MHFWCSHHWGQCNGSKMIQLCNNLILTFGLSEKFQEWLKDSVCQFLVISYSLKGQKPWSSSLPMITRLYNSLPESQFDGNFNLLQTAMGCRQCLPLSDIQLKGKHCRKPNCHNGGVECRYVAAQICSNLTSAFNLKTDGL